MRRFQWLAVLSLTAAVLARALVASAQQRPLVTEDAETIGAGRVLVEGGVDFTHDQQYPVSGLRGNLWRVPTIGVSVGLSSIADLQIDGGFFNRLTITGTNSGAPLAPLLALAGPTSHDVEDTVVGTKIRVLAERPGRPSVGIRFATKLPDASNESGLGLDTTDFYASLLGAKTVQSVRVVGNFGAAILGDPTSGNRQNDVLTYGVSFARALTPEAEVVGELNGRVSIRSAAPPPGTESRGLFMLGGRYTRGSLRVDAGLFFGLMAIDPTVGFTTGFTYVFDAFTVP